MQNFYQKQVICPHCDLVVTVPPLNSGERAVCGRCDTKLFQYVKDNNLHAAAYAISALVFLLASFIFYFIKLDAGGFFASMELYDIPSILAGDNAYALVGYFVLLAICVPAFCLISTILLCLNLLRHNRVKKYILKWLRLLRPWSMAEIFLSGILISFVKLSAYGKISLGISFISYAIFIVFAIKSFIRIDVSQLWHQLMPDNPYECDIKSGKTAKEQGVRRCLNCDAILTALTVECHRCQEKGTARQVNSVQITLALLFSGLIFYLPANYFPVMTTMSLGFEMDSTVVGGAIFMWEEGAYFVGTVIFIASVVIPSFKIVCLFILCRFVKKPQIYSESNCLRMGKLYKAVHFIGRWSMIDVFVVTILASLVKIPGVMNIYPQNGVMFFALVVVITMVATEKFDQRLIWDKSNNTDGVR